MSTTPGEVTQILIDFRRGNSEAQDRLIPLVYKELRRVAGAHLRNESAQNSLQPTALVHESYLRLPDIQQIDAKPRPLFRWLLRLCGEFLWNMPERAMLKAGADITIWVEESLLPSPRRPPKVLALDDALIELARLDERQAKIVEMRFFAGMTEEESGGCARHLGPHRKA